MRTPWCDCAVPRSYVAHPETGVYVHSVAKCLRPTKPVYDLLQSSEEK